MAQLRAKQLEIDSGIEVDVAAQTMAQYLTAWLRDVVKPSVRPSTYASYEGHVRLYFIPAFGDVQLSKLTAQHVQRLLNQQTANGLSPRTVQYMRATLRSALAQAVKWSLVNRNVAALATPPRSRQSEVRPMSPTDAGRFIEACRSIRLGPLYVFTMATGLRQGEALGLHWEDVDLEAGSIRVTKNLTWVDGVPQFTDPKSGKSRRTIVLPEIAKDFLALQQAMTADYRLIAGERWEEWGLVFPSTVGTPLNPSNVTNYLKSFLERLEIPHQRFHDLRHSCATVLLAEGVPARVVMEILGHSQISLTLNTYSHVMPKALDDAASAIDRALGSNRVPREPR